MALVTDLSSHLALVTGATGGIGKATCVALARLNCSIAVHYNTAADTAESLVSQLKAMGVRASRFKADLSSYEETRKLHAEVVEGLGHPTILFNNAGLTMGKSGVKDISEISVEDFEQTWRANCGTGFLLTQLCLPKMVEQGWGRVIFCSSVAAFTGGVVGPHYAYVLRWRAFLQAYTALTLAG
jgi:3-oxoacyl-[acyl-carrier protein] reductase